MHDCRTRFTYCVSSTFPTLVFKVNERCLNFPVLTWQVQIIKTGKSAAHLQQLLKKYVLVQRKYYPSDLVLDHRHHLPPPQRRESHSSNATSSSLVDLLTLVGSGGGNGVVPGGRVASVSASDLLLTEDHWDEAEYMPARGATGEISTEVRE